MRLQTSLEQASFSQIQKQSMLDINNNCPCQGIFTSLLFNVMKYGAVLQISFHLFLATFFFQIWLRKYGTDRITSTN